LAEALLKKSRGIIDRNFSYSLSKEKSTHLGKFASCIIKDVLMSDLHGQHLANASMGEEWQYVLAGHTFRGAPLPQK